MTLGEAIETRAGELQSVHAETLAAMRLALGVLAINSNRTWREEQAMQALSAALAREEAR